MINFGEIALQICVQVVTIIVLACAGYLVLIPGIRNIVGHGSSEPRDPNPPPGLTKDAQVNDSVWKLYSPPIGEKHDVDIIFFHGLQLGDFEDAFWKTWVAKNDDQVVWPQKWLTKKLPRARILSVSYNSSATKRAGQTGMYLLGENLVSDIIHSEEDIGQTCPVFLVGHSLGGIVIKRFILSADNAKIKMNPEQYTREIARINTFLGNFKGAFYYATPHEGSRIADLARHIPGTSPILELLKTLDTKRARINEDFRQRRANLHAKSCTIAENLEINYRGFHAKVVEEAAARPDGDQFYTHTTANHFTVCKARDTNDFTVIGRLAQFVTENSPAGTIEYIRRDESASVLC